ncbi:MAG: hypothetical protein AAFU33_20580 [Bacteroidota bacterium]
MMAVPKAFFDMDGEAFFVFLLARVATFGAGGADFACGVWGEVDVVVMEHEVVFE